MNTKFIQNGSSSPCSRVLCSSKFPMKSTPSHSATNIPAMRAFINSVISADRFELSEGHKIILDIMVIIDDNAKLPSQSLRKRMSHTEDIQRGKYGWEHERRKQFPLLLPDSIKSKAGKAFTNGRSFRLNGLTMDLSWDDRWQNFVKFEHSSCHKPPPKPLRSLSTVLIAMDSPV